MRTLIGFAVSIGFVLTASTGAALAQPAPKGKGKAPKAEVKTYDFDGDTLEGDLLKPDGTSVDVRDFGGHDSLIRIRKDFIDEIIKSAEDL